MKPFLKWVGGKTQILPHVMSSFPSHIHTYHEIFLGGGSVLFALLESSINVQFIKAYDYNNVLIHVYRNIQSDPRAFWEQMRPCIDAYTVSLNKEAHYYACRNKYNEMSVIDKCSQVGSALFVMLNKTCFRGLYREGPNGFNVPFGHNKNPSIASWQHILNVSTLIQKVTFIQADFVDSINDVSDGDFVYLDPPYVPENKTSFVGYNRSVFDENTHITLFNLCKSNRFSFLMSNSNVPLVTTAFTNYNTTIIEAKRLINCNKPNAKTLEVLISFTRVANS